MKNISLIAVFFSLLLPYSSAWAVIDYCAILDIKHKRITHHMDQLNKLNELKNLVTEATEIQRMLNRKGQLPGQYDGFDQVLTNMQKEVNEMVDEQREDLKDFRNYTLATVIFSLVIFKHIKTQVQHKSIQRAFSELSSVSKVKASMLIASIALIYLSYNKFGKIKDNADKIVELKALIEKLNGLEIKQGEIDYLEGLIAEDQEKLNHNMRLWSKQGKITSASFENDELVCE